ncbi:interleukin-1 receptor accessory protein isoform X2 [Lampris incognitus]|uniref:interleukin-1 receptor accessory protein isoform X2 n=1 Tax=Lampris incognitus TaxID=2546036 RepID=UPI0024B5D659|nr:interleukin-1 receptor accessory protein isoform X2 [Lampris incognitus]
MCHDWGEAGQRAVRVLEGETSWLSCPLFSHPTVYNYTSAQRAGLNLFWYHVPAGQDLEQPIEYSQRLSKERERLWLQPATMEDKGQYICMLSNKSSCTKIAMRLEVLSHEEAGPGQAHEVPVAVAPTHVVIPFQEGETLECPNLQDISKMADDQPTVTWHNVNRFWNSDREVKKGRLVIHLMLENYQDLYYCFVSYHRHGKNLRFTRVINVTAVSPSRLPKVPSILYPTQDHVYTVKLEVRLQCTGMFPYLEGPLHIWWTVDGKTVDQLSDTRFSKTDRPVKSDFGDRTEESVLLIQDFQTADLDRKYQCSVRNQKGNATRTATLQKEENLPSVELGCGLGVVLVLMLILFGVYHVFWLELLLFYRSWFGTDERYTDDKEFDVYISYARQYEEENFVLSTLRRVLENELGYTVCIFDRDSLPGGTITDETLTFVRRSRRLLVVLSPGYAARGSQALLELKAGLDGMALGGHLRVILVQYRPLQRHAWVRELRRARVALALVRWQGDKSNELTSYFWKRLRVELPMRRPEGGVAGEVGAVPPRRLESQNSTSSQTGLITNTMKEPQKVLNLY